jgi:hypothetical protein
MRRATETVNESWAGNDAGRERAMAWLADQLRWEGVLRSLRQQLEHGSRDEELVNAA